MSDSNWDAVQLKSKRRVKLLGCGVFPPSGETLRNPPGWKLEFKIFVDGNQTDTFIFTSSEENWDAENKIYRCIFHENGSNDIACDEGQKIDICQRYKEGPRPQHRYLENGMVDGIPD